MTPPSRIRVPSCSSISPPPPRPPIQTRCQIKFRQVRRSDLAEHALLRRPCVIKRIRPERAGDPASLLRFEREVQATATLTNWHTVEIFDYGHAADGTFYYVMEYLRGMSLAEMVWNHGPLPPERVTDAVRLRLRAARAERSASPLSCDPLRRQPAAGTVRVRCAPRPMSRAPARGGRVAPVVKPCCPALPSSP